jgi:hypothetical protein
MEQMLERMLANQERMEAKIEANNETGEDPSRKYVDLSRRDESQSSKRNEISVT